jgi:hypothetical protein
MLIFFFCLGIGRIARTCHLPPFFYRWLVAPFSSTSPFLSQSISDNFYSFLKEVTRGKSSYNSDLVSTLSSSLFIPAGSYSVYSSSFPTLHPYFLHHILPKVIEDHQRPSLSRSESSTNLNTDRSSLSSSRFRFRSVLPLPPLSSFLSLPLGTDENQKNNPIPPTIIPLIHCLHNGSVNRKHAAATLASMSILSLSSLIRYANNTSFSLSASLSSNSPIDLPLSSLSSSKSPFSTNSTTFYTLPTQVKSAIIFALSRVELGSFPSTTSYSSTSKLSSLIYPSLLSPDAVVECIHQAINDPIPIIKFFFFYSCSFFDF